MVSDNKNKKNTSDKMMVNEYTHLTSTQSFHKLFNWIEETAYDVYLILNESGELIYATKSIESLLGYNQYEIKGVYWKNLLNEEEANLLERKLHKQTNKKQSFKINIRHKNERYIWCEGIIGRELDYSSNDSYFLCTLKDISEKKEVEEMMIRSEKMSIAGQLAAGVAHEIRNPLTAIKGFLQLLQAGISKKEEYYKIMIDEIEKMESITSEMLFISKPLTDHQQKESVTQMVDDILILLRAQAKLKDVELLFQESKDSFIYCDKSQVKQVLLNIIKNAIEAMDAPGKIQINHTTTENYVKINIMDEGQGIPEEIIHKLDEPFFTTKENGTGLGLMITKQILKQHNAVMKISQNNHKGSTFQLRFFK